MSMYRDPVLKALIDMLNEHGPAALKNRYFIGDPVEIPKSERMPVCFVSRDTSIISIESNNEDLREMAVVLNVVYDGAQQLGQAGWAQAGAQAIYELVEGSDEHFSLREDSLAGALRRQQVFDGNDRLFIDVTGSNLQIEYALSPPERRGLWSVEAIIRTTLKHLQLRN